MALAQQNQLPTAEAAFTEAWTLRQLVLGANAAPTLLSRHNLAVVLLGLRRDAEACTHMQAAWQGRVQLLGEQHVDTQLSRSFIERIPACLKPR